MLPQRTPEQTPGAAAGVALIVDDNSINRMVLQELLAKEGYAVHMAAQGAEAVRIFTDETVDIVLMDVMMPVMDGYEATRRIKDICVAREMYCPVLFVTAVTDENSLAACIDSGGDDFLVKPYNRIVLRAKMKSLERMRNLYTLAQEQKDALVAQHDYLAQEHDIAERTFGKIMQTGFAGAPNLRHLLTSVGRVSGDMLLAEYRPDGIQHILLGDFTGHGLAAAMGAIPVSDIFQSMTRKGLGIELIATELNRKLKQKLPVGLFLAGCLLAVDAAAMRVSVWNGGIPEVLVRRPGAGVHARIPSRHLPLGILDDKHFDAAVDVVEVRQDDAIYVYSDGVIETVDATGAMFGATRLEAIVHRPDVDADAGNGFAAICDALDAFRQGCPQHDDITLLEIECRAAPAPGGDERADDTVPAVVLSMEYGPSKLREDDVQTHIERVLGMLPEVQGHRGRLYTVVSELFNNALEHGLLRMDSTLKCDAEGFQHYYYLREQRLSNLEQGNIRVTLKLFGDTDLGQLCIDVVDSGPGFEHATFRPSGSNRIFSQRGLTLVRTLCRQVEFRGMGNSVHAIYVWPTAEDA